MQTAGHRCVCVPTRAFSGHVGVCLAERALKRTNDWDAKIGTLMIRRGDFLSKKSHNPANRIGDPGRRGLRPPPIRQAPQARKVEGERGRLARVLNVFIFRRLEWAPAGRAPRLDAASLTLRQVTRRDTRPPAGRSVFTWACIWDPGPGRRV